MGSRTYPHSITQAGWGAAASVVMVLLILAGGRLAGQTVTTSLDPWSRLTAKSAWVNLGLWEPGTQNWITNPPYSIVGDAATGTDVRLPRVGDRLRISSRVTLMIVNFESEGERMYRGSIANLAFRGADVVGNLEQGALIEVQEVSIGNALDAHTINVRVKPSTAGGDVVSP